MVLDVIGDLIDWLLAVVFWLVVVPFVALALYAAVKHRHLWRWTIRVSWKWTSPRHFRVWTTELDDDATDPTLGVSR